MNTVFETIMGQPVSKANSYMAVPDGDGGKRIIKNDKIRAYERSFCDQCRIYRDKGINRPFRLHIVVYESSNAYDLDNCLKTVLDCLQYAGAITNDNLCVGISATKKLDREHPRIEYGIEELEPRLF